MPALKLEEQEVGAWEAEFGPTASEGAGVSFLRTKLCQNPDKQGSSRDPREEHGPATDTDSSLVRLLDL